MNLVILMGRLTRDPDVRYSSGENGTCMARYTLAVDRMDKNKTADFIGCVAFGKSAEFAEKWLHQGQRVLVTGRIQTGSYTNRDGQKVYTTDVVVINQEFADSKAAGNYTEQPKAEQPKVKDGEFMNIADAVNEELPWD